MDDKTFDTLSKAEHSLWEANSILLGLQVVGEGGDIQPIRDALYRVVNDIQKLKWTEDK